MRQVELLYISRESEVLNLKRALAILYMQMCLLSGEAT